ncbi:hypothetical protein V6N13_075674 [Hibiscus sabdariffa]|uniref:Uncharacterized protein n=1 Tax=Hibiscus sabdariffa TaxID=183260 RepID=A0ABR2UCH6_9ROSI
MRDSSTVDSCSYISLTAQILRRVVSRVFFSEREEEEGHNKIPPLSVSLSPFLSENEKWRRRRRKMGVEVEVYREAGRAEKKHLRLSPNNGSVFPKKMMLDCLLSFLFSSSHAKPLRL